MLMLTDMGRQLAAVERRMRELNYEEQRIQVPIPVTIWGMLALSFAT